MRFTQETFQGTMLKRYKRFLSDIRLSDGQIVTAHTANTGSMKTCWEPGWPVILSKSTNEKRKLPYSLELISNGQTWIGVNTSLPNKLAREAIEAGIIPELSGYSTLTPEFSIGESRIDFLLQEQEQKCFVEVKNVTLKAQDSRARFPDSISLRAQKHVNELIELKKQGHRAVLLFIIQREDVDKFSPSYDDDPYYSLLLQMAFEEGVEILPYQCQINPSEIKVTRKIPLEFS